MRKLTQEQKNTITLRFSKVAQMVIREVEKFGDEKEVLENDVEMAIDIIKAKSE